jgi:hypothetical protein
METTETMGIDTMLTMMKRSMILELLIRQCISMPETILYIMEVNITLHYINSSGFR